MKFASLLCSLLLGAVLLGGCRTAKDPAAASVPDQPKPTPAATAEPEPTPSPALAACMDNATGTQPVITDPETWNEEGRRIIDELADSWYGRAGFTGGEKKGYPYLLAVNRAASTVTVYTLDDEGRYTVPFMAMVCSGGSDTPLGYWGTPVKYQWRLLAGPCYGQYATRIWDSYLFHSVPYYTQHKDDVEYDQFNQLGTLASLGCIRLAVVDVKWVYDNCELGTPVIIYDDEETPGPMGKPGTIYTDPANLETRGWDPTDPDPVNPWPAQYRTGTAIRSDAAWAQWESEHETWNESITPTNLRGYSTDSAIEGTRG